MSPVNIQGMVQIAKFHGLTVTALDLPPPPMPHVSRSKYNSITPTLQQIKDHLDSHTKSVKIVLIAHVFGAVDEVEFDKIATYINERNSSSPGSPILLIEDCAESFTRLHSHSHDNPNTYTSHPLSHVSLFSFGTIKTRTSLGGGILLLNQNPTNPYSNLLPQIKKLQSRLPKLLPWR